MATRAYKQIVLGTFLLGTTALVAPAVAQPLPPPTNQITAVDLTSTNIGNILSLTTLGQPQLIQSGITNNIGAGATAAFGFAGIDQTVSQSTVQQGANTQGGNSIVVQDISATNNAIAPIVPATPALIGVATSHVEAIVDAQISIIGTVGPNSNLSQATGGGISNSIGASASGAAAVANIAQNFDTNAGIDLTQLASNQIKVGTLTAANTASSVEARLNPGSQALIADGIGNSITAQAVGASAGAAIGSHMLDTANTFPNVNNLVSVATNTVKTGDISAANSGAVTATYGLGNPASLQFQIPGGSATILNGIGNTIGATAAGASASASIDQSVDFTTFTTNQGPGTVLLDVVYGNSVTTGSLSAFNSKDGVVTATLGIPSPQILPFALPPGPIAGAIISNGIGNAIAAQASGASAGGSIDQRYANVSALGGFSAPLAATNSLTTGAMSAVNHGHVSAYAATFPQNLNSPSSVISAGIGNSIGATAVGASTGLGITQDVSSSFIVEALPVNNTAKADGGMTARNGKNATIEAILGQFGPALISNGAGNTIGATAIGASSGATINQSVLGTLTDVASLGSNTVIVKDTGAGNNAMVARNAGAVTATFVPATGPGTSATISDGVANSISAQAVGATVNASITSRFDNTTTGGLNQNAVLPVNKIDTTNGTANNLLARNTGAVTATFGPLFGSTPGDLQIVTGVANHIGASAVGADASASVNQSVSFELNLGNPPTNLQVATTDLPINIVRTGDITAKNFGNVTSTLSSGNATIGTTPISQPAVAGVGNSISAQSVGAAANASITSQFYNVVSIPGQATTPATNKVVTGNLTATNNPASSTNGLPATGIVATATIGTVTNNPGNTAPASASIITGVSNFIGASAVGASAGAGITQSVSETFQGLSFDTTLLPANSITAQNVTATNAAPVTAILTVANGTAQIGPAGAPLSLSTSNVGNSIAAQAVGASASASITTEVFNTSIPQSTTLPAALATNTVKVASLSSTNSGPVQANASFSNFNTGPAVSINGGVGNYIGASATGASSVASINQVVSASTTTSINGPAGSISSLNTLAANSITVSGPITATNSGNITASLSTTGQGFPFNGILGGVGNSISANAVGAMAGVSITQSIANSH